MRPPVRVFHFLDAHQAVAGRSVRVWAPKQVAAGNDGALPVVYLLDGQNLFGSARGEKSWRADRTAQQLIDAARVPPMLLVGIDHSGPHRTDDYTTVRWQHRGGHAADFARLLLDEIKPFVDAHYPTARGPVDTAIVGASLGGLFALELALARPDVFGRVAALSPSTWWADEQLLQTIAALPQQMPLRIWIDAGKSEAPPLRRGVREAARLLQAKGWQPHRLAKKATLRHVEVPGARHDERAWGRRFGRVLKFLFPAPAKRRQRGGQQAATG